MGSYYLLSLIDAEEPSAVDIVPFDESEEFSSTETKTEMNAISKGMTQRNRPGENETCSSGSSISQNSKESSPASLRPLHN